MKILIIEDEKPAARRLVQLITEKIPEAEIYSNIDTVTSAVEWLNKNPHPDLVFLDIQLADGISFEIFEKVKVTAPIIFCTAYDQYAIKAFKLNSIDYLLKPVDPDELEQALNKFQSGRKVPAVSLDEIRNLLQNTQKTFKNRFLVKTGERIQTVDVQEIAFFFSEDKATLLQTRQGKKFIIDYTLDEVESMISPDDFFRMNRKYISSVAAIKDVFTYSSSRLKIHLENCTDNDILISREKTGAFKSWLGQ
ncbi:LytR/AlgR family response regulator transcription factor [Dyadobacter sediminis]|uniref:Response regulator transcription factor n=1 Tax=Dyadobacter sediminis TaxID=1493691 RepID=A0A5R9KDT8_9BACT|nr:LytTR family DNA-binding domain-containing protein [Dyadobacter sediminis]TLU94226.1 response regulator transcription factor [Dyadobacter sediminis]GGB93117.1 DNA-binding response regulator [Dyadobacter sediminis]